MVDVHDVTRELERFLDAHGNNVRHSLLHADYYASLEAFWKLNKVYRQFIDDEDKKLEGSNG